MSRESGDDWEELIERHLRGELSESEKERLAEILDSDPTARRGFVDIVHWDTRFAEVLRETDDGHGLFGAAEVADKASAPAAQREEAGKFSRRTLAVAVVALIAAAYFLPPRTERKIAKITGMSGSLQWTGGGGQIVRDLDIGAELLGGTIEALTPDSWFELEFNDGSIVAITGQSTLTFSDRGQKELSLKEGNLSSNVKPQPPGKPMLIHTRSAMLEVVGTQFEVEAGLSSTMLNVSKGKVRLKRLSDGSTVDVPSGYRVITASNRDMSPVRVPDSVSRWKSQLRRGSEGTYGKWLPATDRRAATLKTIPFVPRENPSVTLYLLGLRVSRADGSPVILRPGSRFVVRGRIASPAKIYFGFQLAHLNGEFAGKFRADKPAADFKGQRDFEAVFYLRDFAIDPCVRDRKDELPSQPEGLDLTGVWCFTVDQTTGTAGLEVTEVELIPPTDDKQI